MGGWGVFTAGDGDGDGGVVRSVGGRWWVGLCTLAALLGAGGGCG